MPSGECSIEPWVFMNWRRAAYYLFTAEVIDAKKALEVGLVNEVVPREDLDARVDQIARHIAQAPLTTLMATKANLKRAWELMGMRVHWQSSNDLVALASIGNDVQALIGRCSRASMLPKEMAPAAGRRKRRRQGRTRPAVNIADHAIGAADVAGADHRGAATAVSYGELYARSQRVAALLHAAGLRRGDGVALVLPNRPEFLEVTWGCQLSGLYYTPVNTHLTPDEVDYIVDDSRGEGRCSSTRRWRSWRANPRSATRASTCASSSEGASRAGGRTRRRSAMRRDAPQASDGSEMLYSSGTTGRPKAVRRPLPEDGNGLVGAEGPGGCAHAALRHDGVERVPVARAALSRCRASTTRWRFIASAPRRSSCRRFDAESVLRADRNAPRHACAVRADDVRADAQAARRGPRVLRRLVASSACCTRPPRARSTSSTG